MSLSEQSKGGRESLLEQSKGESGGAALLGYAGGTLPGETCKKGTGGKSLDKSVYFSSFLAVKEDVFRFHINFFAFHPPLDDLRKQC